MSPDASHVSGSPDDLQSGDMAESTLDRAQTDEQSPANSKDGTETPAKRNAKDPSRPRRKKARRACFACQRAHLTCGDERPCLRCIKRGLQGHCHDGVRKKAKYLHDAPNEALLPGAGGNYQSVNDEQPPSTSMAGLGDLGPGSSSMAQTAPFYGGQMPSVYPSFGQATAGGQTQSPTVQDASIMDPFAHQQNSLPNTNYGDNVGQTLSMQDTSASLDQSSNQAPHQTQPFTSPFFDPSDPSLFTFDISGLNFGNHYGALEFGMLGHMSSGAVETADDSALMSSMNQGSNVTFDNSGANSNTYPTPNSNFAYTSNNSNFPSWQGNTDSSSSHANMNQMSNPAITTQDSSNLDSQSVFPHAFAIGEGNGSIGTASPAATNMDFAAGYGTSPASSALFNNSGLHQPEFARQHGQQQRQQSRHSFPTSTDLHRHDATRKRKRDPSQIYTSVQAPYSYTAGFHSLTAFLQKRFSAQKTLRIAKALASIRPSFISCTKQLNRDDLIFMEKCFQRTLWEYEDFINAYGTPTVICRRTGEVAAVSKEFSLLTGWRRDVLLGKEPNLNVNTGGTSGHLTGTSSRGAATPRVAVNGSGELTPGRPQPVFLAELLDDDSVIQFYEDFAKLAFGDSRGYVITPCKLLKYKTKDEPGWGSARDGLGKAAGDAKTAPVSAAAGGIGDPLISGEAGMNVLGDRDGKVNCMYCWSVKRDVFDIPMLIVMNFLPCI